MSLRRFVEPKWRLSDAEPQKWSLYYGRQIRLPRKTWPPSLPTWKHKYLARINQIGIADLISVSPVDDGIAHTRAVGVAANTPKVIAAGHPSRLNFGHDDRRGSAAWQLGARRSWLQCNYSRRPWGGGWLLHGYRWRQWNILGDR